GVVVRIASRAQLVLVTLVVAGLVACGGASSGDRVESGTRSEQRSVEVGVAAKTLSDAIMSTPFVQALDIGDMRPFFSDLSKWSDVLVVARLVDAQVGAIVPLSTTRLVCEPKEGTPSGGDCTSVFRMQTVDVD